MTLALSGGGGHEMIKVGQRVSFTPFHQTYSDKDRLKFQRDLEPVEGRVFKVNQRGVIFVAYMVHGVALRESFQLCDIGQRLQVLD